MSDGQAGEALAAQGLVVGTVTEVHDEAVPAHFVISWEPAGQEIPKGNPVNLVVSKGPAPRVVPEVGGSYDNAVAALAGVQLKAAKEEVFSDTVPGGRGRRHRAGRGSERRAGRRRDCPSLEGARPRGVPSVAGPVAPRGDRRDRGGGVEPRPALRAGARQAHLHEPRRGRAGEAGSARSTSTSVSESPRLASHGGRRLACPRTLE